MTKPLNPQSLRTRRLIRDVRAAGLEVVQVWEEIDGTVKLVMGLEESVEEEGEGDTWADVA